MKPKGMRLARLVKPVRGKFTRWKVGEFVKARCYSGSAHIIERVKWRQPKCPLFNQCCGVPRSALQFLALLLVALLSGCAHPKPAPLPRKPLALVRPRLLTVDTNYVQGPFRRAVAWQYPAGMDPDARCWILQTSTNLADWTDVPSTCLTDPMTAAASNRSGFFRLKSR